MSRLFWKLFLSLWLSIMGFALLTAWVNAAFVQQGIPDPPDVAFERSIDKVEAMLTDALRRGGPDRARQVLERLPRPILHHVYVLDEDGRELLGRDRARRHLDRDRPHDVRRVLRDAEGRVWEMVVLRRVQLARFLEPGFRGIVHRLLMAALVSAVVSFFLARYLARPLERLGRASRELATGDLSVRVGAPLTGRSDEFGALARDFDEMASRLEGLQRASRRLLRDVSHELRSPLARLRVALELARSRGSGDVAEELDRIDLEGRRLEALVGEVLDLVQSTSEASPLRRERFDLCALLQEVGELAAYEAAPDGAGVRVLCQGPVWVEADRELLWRVIENLVRNALIHAGDKAGIEVAAMPSGDHRRVEIAVRDRGPGVPEDQLERLFDAFYRVEESRDRRTGGHGLGLAIAAAGVRRHHGRIEARNRPGGGLEVRVELPVASTHA